MIDPPTPLTVALSDVLGQGTEDDANVVQSAIAEHDFPTGSRGRALLARASAIFTPRARDLVHLVIAAFGRQLRLLRVDAEVLAPVQVRNTDGTDDGVMVRQHVGQFEVATHVATAGDTFSVSLDLLNAESRETRVTLLRGGRELASELPRRGRVFFDALGAGNYQVVLEDAEGHVGELDLSLQRAAA
ncbi:MAG: hypothetical protein ACI9MR_001343 [Myxococcota bacterium]|jgi:hypothetical protein